MQASAPVSRIHPDWTVVSRSVGDVGGQQRPLLEPAWWREAGHGLGTSGKAASPGPAVRASALPWFEHLKIARLDAKCPISNAS